MTPPAERPTPLRDLGISLNVATLLLAAPLYDQLTANPGAALLARLGLLVQIAPALALFLVARLVARLPDGRRWSNRFWALPVAAALCLFGVETLRSARWLHWTTLPLWQRASLGLLLLVGIAAASALRGAALLALFSRAAPVSLAISTGFLAWLALATPAPSPSPPPAEARRDSVYVLIFDELGRDVLLGGGASSGQIDGVRYPNLKALAAGGVWFADATANYGNTCASVPSLLSGRYLAGPLAGNGRACAALAPADSALLRALGRHYRISVYEEYLRDCDDPSTYTCRGIPSLIASRPGQALLAHAVSLVPENLDALRARWLPWPAHAYSLDLYRDLLSDVAADRAPGRLYLAHIQLPHFPFEYDARGQLHHSPDQVFTGQADQDARALRNYEQQTALVDSLVGQLVDRLRLEGLLADATIVVTSDHGPRLGIPPSPEHIALVANVPLIIRGPRLTPGVSEVEYQHVDLAPTLLDALGLAPLEGSPLDGRSALGGAHPARDRAITIAGEGTFVRDSETGRWTLTAGEAPRPRGSRR